MTHIHVVVQSGDARADRVGRALFEGLKDRMGTLPFTLEVQAYADDGMKKLGSATYTNEGKPA